MKFFLAALLLLPFALQAGTMRDFFHNHPDLDNNLPIHTAISKASRFEAAGYARREGGGEDQLMKNKGDQFAVLGFRKIKNACLYPEAAAVWGLSPEDCKLVSGTNI